MRASATARRRSAAGRGRCRICGRWLSLRPNGTIWRHDPPPADRAPGSPALTSCLGSRRRPEGHLEQQLPPSVQAVQQQLFAA